MNQLVIIGAGGHGKVVADIARKNGYRNIVFLDDNESLTMCGSYRVVGTVKDFQHYDCDFFVAIGNGKARRSISEMLLAAGKKLITLIHPSAIIAENVEIGLGTVVVAEAVINPGTVVGRGCIINTCSSVDHDCRLGDYSHISVGVHTAGDVVLGENVWLGIGVIVSNDVHICSDTLVGSGAVVVKNITEPGTYIGMPARKYENPDISQ